MNPPDLELYAGTGGPIFDPGMHASVAPEDSLDTRVRGTTGRRYATLTFLRGALVSLAVTLIAGMMAALYTVPGLAPFFQEAHIDMRSLRPVHTTFATAWILLAGITVVHRWIQEESAGAGLTAGEKLRLRIQVLAWGAAGAGILVTLAMGITSGREYVGFHPAFSILILIGWLAFLWNFWRFAGRGFWGRPVYVTMWGVGSLFFLYTFLEQHAYMLPQVFSDPLVDKRIQWKASGTLVGSFNLFVYGSLIYVGEKLSGDSRYGHSRIAYALFGVGLLNSFTNFGHHTYGLPQSHAVKWIAFVVSMTEIIILLRAVQDVAKLAASKFEGQPGPPRPTSTLLAWAKMWSAAMLCSSILISIPPLNALIHGTYAVTGHAMGATIGIDTMVLLAALSALLCEQARDRWGVASWSKEMTLRNRRLVIALNLSVAGLVVWLHIHGAVEGYHRWLTPFPEPYVLPAWLTTGSPIVIAVFGVAAFFTFGGLMATWLPRVLGGVRP